MKFTKIALTSAILLATGSALAATNPTAAEVGDSDASSQVTLSISDYFMVSKLSDIEFTDQNTSQSLTDGICVYHRGDADYGITFTSTNSDATTNDFRMVDGSNFVKYTVAYNDGSSNFTSITSGTKITTATNAHTTQTNCGGATNTNGTITLTTEQNSLTAAPVGNYSDTLTVLVSPQ